MKNIQYLSKHLGYILGLGATQIFMVASLAVAAQAASSESITGCYYEFIAPVSPEDGIPHPAYNTLELTRIGNDRYEFSAVVIGGNFHICRGEGIAIAKKRGRNPVLVEMLGDREQIEEEAEQSSGPCQLRIRFTRDAVMIEDDNNACRLLRCGLNAAFDTRFLRKNKRSKCPDQP